jgi:signal transduction histidine kinase
MAEAAPRVDRWMLPGALAHAADPDGAPGRRRTPRDWAVDVTLFVLAVLVAVVEQVGLVTSDALGLPAWLRIVDPVLGGLLCLSLWWRRRFPVALGIAAALVAAVSNTAFLALAILLFSVALHRGWAVAVPIAAAQALLGMPYIVLYFPASFGPPLLWFVAILLGAGFVVAAGLGVRARRQLVIALRMRADADRREHARQLEESRRAERQRIAREMHDVLAHRISLLSVHAGALEYRTAMAEEGVAAPPTAEEVRSAVRVVRSNATQALDELREVLDLLRQPGSNGDRETARAVPQPTADRIPALVEEARRSGQTVRADIAAGVADLRPQLQRTVYRIVQEGLTNARKHAPGAAVDVLVRGGPEREVLVQVANAAPIGVTASEIPGAGSGLTGLAERVALHGGELTRDVRDGQFQLRARIPCVP